MNLLINELGALGNFVFIVSYQRSNMASNYLILCW